MKKVLLFCLPLLAAFMAVSCEKALITADEDDIDEPVTEVDGKRRVHFNVSPLVQTAFDNASDNNAAGQGRTQKALSDVCSRLSLAVFNTDGEKVGTIKNQLSTDNDFGLFSLSLADGTYTVVLLAHSGDANFSGSSLSKLTANYKVTDTFYYCDDITIDAEADNDYTFELRRCVAKVHLAFTEPLSKEVAKVQFVYKGGSSTFDAATGHGSVNSTQNETRSVVNWQTPDFDIYTFPHDDEDELTSLQIAALDASGNSLMQKELNDIPVRLNFITHVEGDFFGENPDDGRGKIIVTIDDTWAGTIPYYF